MPAPVVTFADLGVPALLVAALAEDGFAVPFPVQAATLPDALAGADILGRAQTGSGKTLGFCIPLVARLAGGYTMACRPRGLVLVPSIICLPSRRPTGWRLSRPWPAVPTAC
jgi:superfamily II DNA/RNA helicase